LFRRKPTARRAAEKEYEPRTNLVRQSRNHKEKAVLLVRRLWLSNQANLYEREKQRHEDFYTTF
jgi:hypothetical protein